MLQKIRYYWSERPLPLILSAGMLFRLIAVIFSKGYGMVDDHFLIIEQAQSWVDKADVGGWLPQLNPKATPPGFSYFYTGLHYLLFTALEKTGVYDPQLKMYVVRLIHALYSLLTVYFGYRITEKLSGREMAKQAGLLLSLFWLFPFLSVRNLVEVVCIPMLMWATWLAVKKENGNFLYYVGTGAVLGIAFNIRFQVFFFIVGFILALLLQKKFAVAIACSIGILLCAVIVQGGIDWYVWHEPFIEFREYVRYNLSHAKAFIILPWFSYLLFIAGILIPPVSIFLLAGFFSAARKYSLLFLPSFIFLVFHSAFPNKQERFILPILPFIILLGVIGWHELSIRKGYHARFGKALRYTRVWFASLNIVLLLVITFTYTKRNRVEAMRYLAHKGDVHSLVVDNTNNDEDILSPRFYMHQWPREFYLHNGVDINGILTEARNARGYKKPEYIIFYDDGHLQQRIERIQHFFVLKYETTVYPGFMDDIMHRLNPVNENSVTYIYKIIGDK